MGHYAKRFFGKGGIPIDYILAYDFNNNLTDKSINNNTGIGLGTYAFTIGRKGVANTAIQFTTGVVKTTNNLALSTTDKVSISFWFKQSTMGDSIIFEHSISYTGNNAFSIQYGYGNKFLIGDRTIVPNLFHITIQPSSTFSDNTWHFAVIQIDRSLPEISEQKLYVDGNLISMIQYFSYGGDMSGNYSNQILYIGSRNNTSLFYKGALSEIKVYPRILTINEIVALQNE